MKKKIIYILLGIVALIGLTYLGISLFTTRNMTSSIILDKTTTKEGIELSVYHAGKTKTLVAPKDMKIEAAPAYNIKSRRGTVVSITPSKYYSGKILAIDENTITLPSGKVETTSSTKYFKVQGPDIQEISNKALLVGYQGYRFIMDNDNKVKYVLCSIPKVNRIRTLISNSDYSSSNHKYVTFTFDGDGEIRSKDFNYKLQSKDSLTASLDGNNIKYTLTRGSSTTVIGTSPLRVELIQGDSLKVSIPSNKRSNGYIPSYYGSFEMYPTKDGIKLINEAYIDNYLKGTVPSEMPTSGGLEGYKIQSLVSRTAAFYNILSGQYANIGVHVLDSGENQYESMVTNSQSEDAIESTSGEIVTINNEIIDPKFYSTSPGFGASYEDVFGKTVPTKDYLVSQSFDTSSTDINYSNEEDITSYLKDWTVTSYDSNSPLFRWKYSIDYSALSKMINENIKSIYKKSPKSISKKGYLFYTSVDVTKNPPGKIKDIYISGRNPSGVTTELMLVSENGTYRIKGSESIKALLIPSEGFELNTIFGKPSENTKYIPSSFFTIEKNMVGDKFKSLTIYGGGEGHGVGLSKHGAIGLSRQGKNYKDVIKTFYKNVEIVNINKEFRLEVENRK
ncbi:MAG: SpoIID/LytB domain-containing protein [Clostridium sp.]